MNPQPKLALTLGDPAGIGTEIVLKALADPVLYKMLSTITVVGDRSQVQDIYLSLKAHTNLPLADPDSFEMLDTATLEPIAIGVGNAASGAASFTYLDTAIAQALAGKFDAIVTAPIAKSAWKLAGHHYPGQTELLAERSGVKEFGMLFVGRSPHTGWILRTLLATVHIPLSEVTQALTPDLIERKLELLRRSLLKDFGLPQARIAIAGINPHSGEQGQLGTEEQEWLNPLLKQWNHKYPDFPVDGAIPPDTMWVKPAQAWYESDRIHVGHDAYLAMYHDQGLIPVKLLAFDRAVNTTIGLPFVRTSPDHGTAFDIAGKGIANPASLIESILLAADLASYRKLKN
ncbi:4-hydroxythreonine-4-phosphate dehydrogenase PdxA [Tumidithrix helvetica PCC 7403]|uniref:4-hydroxythreonine-4-phosphate dehydrogenase PdxA n=1 Tax=Tumidithrix helvetica TaxID=3457545 RepID=UPI003CA32599